MLFFIILVMRGLQIEEVHPEIYPEKHILRSQRSVEDYSYKYVSLEVGEIIQRIGCLFPGIPYGSHAHQE